MMLEILKTTDVEKKMELFLRGFDIAMMEFAHDYDDYGKYLESNCDEFSEQRMQEMAVLELLQRLGFPMKELGTYLFKDVVMYIAQRLEVANEDQDYCKNLLKSVKQPFSQVYFDIARNDKDMGIKSFHASVLSAFEKVDESQRDESLVVSIYGEGCEAIDYKEQAFVLGSYMVERGAKRFDGVANVKRDVMTLEKVVN